MFSENLRNLRKDRGLSQEALAKAVGLSCRTIQNYENGTTLPQSRHIYDRLADYFQVPVHMLADNSPFVKLEKGTFREKAYTKEARDLYRELQYISALFADGNLSRHDRALFFQAIQELYLEANNEDIFYD